MSFLPFMISAIILAFTPGPSITYVVARTIAGGRSEGLASCLGTGLGGLFHVVATSIGLSFIVAQSAIAFTLVKTLGATYLIYLGIRLLFRNHQERTAPVNTISGTPRALLEGIIVEALNVKTALFFLAFLPQFISPTQAMVPQLVLLGSLCVALNTVADVIAVFIAERLLQSDSVRESRARVMTRISGATMLGLGIYLALARRSV